MSLPQWSSPCSGLCEGGITKALIFREKEEILLWPSSLWLRHSTASPLRLSHCSLWNGSWSFTPATSSNSAESYRIEMQVQNFLSFSIQDWTTPETQTVSLLCLCFLIALLGLWCTKELASRHSGFNQQLLKCCCLQLPPAALRSGTQLLRSPPGCRTAGRGDKLQKWVQKGQECFGKPQVSDAAVSVAWAGREQHCRLQGWGCPGKFGSFWAWREQPCTGRTDKHKERLQK